MGSYDLEEVREDSERFNFFLSFVLDLAETNLGLIPIKGTFWVFKGLIKESTGRDRRLL